MTRSIMTFSRVVLFGLGVVISSASAADKITLSSTNPTAFDIDYVVAKEKGFFAKENLDVEPTYMTPDLVIKDNKSFRHEALIDAPGLAEMIRLLAYDKLIPKREPWETFVDQAFLPPGK